MSPGQSYPVYWASSELPQAIQFRPGTGEGYAWSGAVIASEETAGKSWIALYNGMRNAAPGEERRISAYPLKWVFVSASGSIIGI